MTAAPSDAPSDAIVFFGATGDLAKKQIFPALYRLVLEEDLDIPIIGVAKQGWGLDQLKARAKDSLAEHGVDVAGEAFRKMMELLRYVDGDYADPATFADLRRQLGEAKRPLHYLAIPPSLFSIVAKQLAQSGCAKGGRLVIEKPFGHDRASARELDRILQQHFTEAGIFRIDHYLGKEPVQNILYTPLRQPDLRADLEPHVRPQHPDHDGGGVRGGGARPLLRRDRRDPRRAAEPHAAGAGDPDDGPADRRGNRRRARPAGQPAQIGAPARCRARGPRPVSTAIAACPACGPARAWRLSSR